MIDPGPEELTLEDGRRTFGLFELAVQPQWRRQGIATRVHRALVEGLDNARVMLNGRPEATAAQAAYRSWAIGDSEPRFLGRARLHTR
ncbi:GNAT family N-acetyltransferase [Kitasatospora sp. NPDC058032]|uniref:GNAT family N-acetyltransferase n=1 Tax=Kitasatospora sp. NPDC058032 TaxID=3346307 RepID=UPI0036DF7C2A